jgi:hypothetical protein
MSFAGDVPHIRSITRTINDKLNYGGTISGVLEGTLKNVNKNRLDQVCGGFDGRYMWWAMPNGTSSVNNLVICKDTLMRDPDDGWTVHTDIYATVWLRSKITGDDRLYYGHGSKTQLTYLNPNVTLRDGTAIAFEVNSRKYRANTYKKSKYKYVYITLGDSSQSTVVVDGSPDGFTFENQTTITPITSGSVFPMTFPFYLGATLEKKDRINLKGNTNAYTYQLKITERGTAIDTPVSVFPYEFPIDFGSNEADQRLTIKEWSVLHYPRGLRDA